MDGVFKTMINEIRDEFITIHDAFTDFCAGLGLDQMTGGTTEKEIIDFHSFLEEVFEEIKDHFLVLQEQRDGAWQAGRNTERDSHPVDNFVTNEKTNMEKWGF